MLNTEQFTKKAGNYQFAQVNGVSDQTLMGIATEYRTAISRKYQNLPPSIVSQTFSDDTPVHCSVKYDGEQVFVYFDAEKNLCFAFNAPSGRCRTGLPYLEALDQHLRQQQVTKALLVGESYLPHSVDRQTKVSDVISATFAGDSSSQQNLTLALYDIIMLNGKKFFDPSAGFEKNHKQLESLFPGPEKDKFHRVQGSVVPAKEVGGFFTKTTQADHEEGVVVRSLSHATIYKLKPLITVDAVVIGYTEGEFEKQYGATSLLCALYDPSSKRMVALGRIGSGFTDEERVRLLEELKSTKVDAPLNMTDSSGRPISFVRPSLILEIEGESLVTETSDGKPVQAQVFSYQDETTSYQFHGLCDFPMLTHMRYLRPRNDKNWQDGGTRPEQIGSSTNIQAAQSRQTKPGQPIVLERHVYCKKSPKGESIRKAILVQTNDPQKYAYLVHWADFSPNRKVPLETSLEVANTRERAEKLLQHKLSTEIKKGWEKI
jgi:hypothetical protein